MLSGHLSFPIRGTEPGGTFQPHVETSGRGCGQAAWEMTEPPGAGQTTPAWSRGAPPPRPVSEDSRAGLQGQRVKPRECAGGSGDSASPRGLSSKRLSWRILSWEKETPRFTSLKSVENS